MKLYAIGIFNTDLQKLGAAPIVISSFFKNTQDPLMHLIKMLPSAVNEYRPFDIHHSYQAVEKEHHYIKILPTKNIIIGIVSQTPILATELQYLFINISHVIANGKATGFSLDDIITNPLGYIGRDVLIDRVKTDMRDIRMLMIENIEKALTNQNRVGQLFAKSDTLKIESETYAEKTKKSSCC